MLAFGGIMSIAAAIGGNLSSSLPGVAILSLIGVGAIASGAIPLPGWARLRARQMEEVTSQLALLTGSDVPDDKAST